MCKLIGYEPNHYQSAFCELACFINTEVPNGTVIPAFTEFTNSSGSIKYYNLEDIPLTSGMNRFTVHEGVNRSFKITVEDISSNGRVTLSDWNVGTNTFVIKQAGMEFVHVDNAVYGEGELCYSTHISLENDVYIQFPTYYETIISPTAPIEISYLLTNGVGGRIGAGVLEGTGKVGDVIYAYSNQYSSEGGFDPESVEEIRKAAPAYAKTMDTLVTLDDFRILSNSYDGIADVVALDYNYPESGLVQPTDDQVNDAYKVNLYMLLNDSDTILKDDNEIDENKGQYISENTFEETNVKNKSALIFDDEISTGGTMMEAVNIVKSHGAKAVFGHLGQRALPRGLHLAPDVLQSL